MTEPAADARSISLNDIGLRYFQAIQRISDATVFFWAGARSVSEQGYDEFFRSIPGLPSTEFRLSFDRVREEAERSSLKNGLNELLGLVTLFLEDVRKLCGLVAFNVAKAKSQGNLASLAAELNAVVTGQDLAARFRALRERYGVSSPLEGPILSLTALANALFQRGGVLNEGESLRIHLKRIQPPAEGSNEAQMTDFERSWKAGEPITLSRPEHAAIFTTVSLLIGSLLNAVQEFAKQSGLPEASPS